VRLTDDKKKRWIDVLPLIVKTHNFTKNATTSEIPFRAFFGWLPKTALNASYLSGSSAFVEIVPQDKEVSVDPQAMTILNAERENIQQMIKTKQKIAGENYTKRTYLKNRVNTF
jgi:hypothetical protein